VDFVVEFEDGAARVFTGVALGQTKGEVSAGAEQGA